MPIDPSSLRKLETVSPATQAEGFGSDENLVVLVKLRRGAPPPPFIELRGKIAEGLYSASVVGADLPRLEAEPAVESVTVSRSLPLIE